MPVLPVINSTQCLEDSTDLSVEKMPILAMSVLSKYFKQSSSHGWFDSKSGFQTTIKLLIDYFFFLLLSSSCVDAKIGHACKILYLFIYFISGGDGGNPVSFFNIAVLEIGNNL